MTNVNLSVSLTLVLMLFTIGLVYTPAVRANHAIPGLTCSNDPAQTDGAPDDLDPAHHMPRCSGTEKTTSLSTQAPTTPLPVPVSEPVPSLPSQPIVPNVNTNVPCSNDPAQTDGAPDDLDPAHHMPRCSGTEKVTEPVAINPTPALPVSESVTPSLVKIPREASQSNPLTGNTFFRFPYSPAQSQVDAWRNSYPEGATQIMKIASEPQARWLVGGNIDSTAEIVRETVRGATAANKVPVFVTYNIPNRDCGSYSAGGSNGRNEYLSWIRAIAGELGSIESVIAFEPDALTFNDCLTNDAKEARYALVRDAVSILEERPNTHVYIDAGHPEWIAPQEIADRLKKSGIEKAAGFALNVSNFYSTDSNIAYGKEISRLIGDKHFVIDTSRNGGNYVSSYGWCNPSDRRLGISPTSATNSSLVDAYLWIKNPGESDGTCNGGPSAGVWWPEYALGLTR